MNIEKYLLEKGIKPHLKGFAYLTDAIKFCQEDKSLLRAITSKLYNKIAEVNKDTNIRVERAIRNSIAVSGKKITNSEFIATAIIELKD